MSHTLDRNSLLERLTDARKHSPVPVVAQALYLYLVNEAETAGFGAAMPLSDRRIALDLCISVQRMRRARSVLVELGLVSFTPTRSRREFPLYSFVIEHTAVEADSEPVTVECADIVPCADTVQVDADSEPTDRASTPAAKPTEGAPAPPRLSAFERMKRRSLRRAGGPGPRHRGGHNKSA